MLMMQWNKLKPALTKYDNGCRGISRVGDTMVIPTDSFTNLGVIVDENLSMDKLFAKVLRPVCVSIRTIGMIRKHINQPVGELLTHALITSRLDTCNSLLHGLNKTQLKQRFIFKIPMFVFNTIHGVPPITYVALLNRTIHSVFLWADIVWCKPSYCLSFFLSLLQPSELFKAHFSVVIFFLSEIIRLRPFSVP